MSQSKSILNCQSNCLVDLYEHGCRGTISQVYQADKLGICVHWTRFSLQALLTIGTQWANKVILTYYYLLKYFAIRKNIEIPFDVDLNLCFVTNKNMLPIDFSYKGEQDLVVVMQSGNHTSGHYLQLKVDHASKCAVVYDSLTRRNSVLDRFWKVKILFYLKRNKYISELCTVEDIKWPGPFEASTSYILRNTGGSVDKKQGNMPAQNKRKRNYEFSVMWAKEGEYLCMTDEMAGSLKDNQCCAAIVCQELQRSMKLQIDFESKFAPCQGSCSRWRTLNKLVYLLYFAIGNGEIVRIPKPCKVEDVGKEDNEVQIVKGVEGIEVETQLFVKDLLLDGAFKMLLELAKTEYYWILKQGWVDMVLEEQVCSICNEKRAVFPYPNYRAASTDGYTEAEYKDMTTKKLTCGYTACWCCFHVSCMLKCICLGLGTIDWKCDGCFKPVSELVVIN